MTSFEKLLARIRNNRKGVRFEDASKVAEHYFGKPRVKGSHNVYKMPWPGDPRINIQNVGGQVDSYQIEQLLEAIDKLELGLGKGDEGEKHGGA